MKVNNPDINAQSDGGEMNPYQGSAVISPKLQAIVDKYRDPEQRRQLAQLYGPTFVSDIASKFIELPTSEDIVKVDFPQTILNTIAAGIDFIFEQKLALDLNYYDFGHGHIYVDESTYTEYLNLKKLLPKSTESESRLAQLIVNNTKSILFHTQELYDRSAYGYPLDPRKRNIYSEIEGQPYLIYPDEQDANPNYSVGSNKCKPAKEKGLNNTVQVELRLSHEGQIETSIGMVLLWIPHLLVLEGQG